MLRSLTDMEPGAKIHVLCCDDETERAQAPEDVDVITLDTLEKLFGGLREARQNRDWVEYLWTLTPVVMYYLLNDLDEITYVDADLYFFSPLDELYAEAGDHAISAIPHRWTPKHAKRLAPNGKYNVSWLRVRNTEQGLLFLAEWANLCIDSCLKKNMGDQGYLDGLAEKYDIYDIQHLGANLAPWSQEQYAYSIKDGRIHVENDRLLFYHFHEFQHNRKGDVLARTGYSLHPFVAEYIYPVYEDEIRSVCRWLP